MYANSLGSFKQFLSGSTPRIFLNLCVLLCSHVLEISDRVQFLEKIPSGPKEVIFGPKSCLWKFL